MYNCVKHTHSVSPVLSSSCAWSCNLSLSPGHVWLLVLVADPMGTDMTVGFIFSLFVFLLLDKESTPVFFHIICVPTKSSYVRSPWVPGKSLASHCWVRHTKCTWSSFASCFSLNYDEILHFSISELLFILCESFHEDLLEHPCPSCICARQCHHLYLLS